MEVVWDEPVAAFTSQFWMYGQRQRDNRQLRITGQGKLSGLADIFFKDQFGL
jgi:hypothetical protein